MSTEQRGNETDENNVSIRCNKGTIMYLMIILLIQALAGICVIYHNGDWVYGIFLISMSLSMFGLFVYLRRNTHAAKKVFAWLETHWHD